MKMSTRAGSLLLAGLTAVGIGLTAAPAHATDLSPNSGGGGDIPGTYSSVDFYVGDGNWAPTLRLAATASNGARVTIHDSATYSSQLVTSNTGITATTNTDPTKASIVLKRGDDITFTFSTSRQLWLLSTPANTPNSNGGSGAVPLQSGEKISHFNLANGDFASPLTLPATAPEGAMVMISSTAAQSATINSANVLFASTFNLRSGDTYLFTYKTGLHAWVADGTPVQVLDAGNTGGQIPAPVVPNTTVRFGDGNFVSQVALPATAGDRDRITLRSTATWTATISNAHVTDPGTLRLGTGDAYTFMYVKEKGSWVIMAKPEPAYTPNQLLAGQLPNMRSPLARATVSDSIWAPIKLPITAKTGDQVIVSNNSTEAVGVSGLSTTFVTATLGTNETARFVRTSEGKWDRATRTVTMLLSYGQDVVDKAGESVVQQHLSDEVKETNLALENSGANFYVHQVGFVKEQIKSTSIGTILAQARTDTVIQTARTNLKADAVFYVSINDGCGLAYVGASKFNMAAAEGWGCGVYTMRHEFGHNMGLNHCYGTDTGSPYAYGVGWGLISDSMCGNSVSAYTNPNTYTADYGIAMGIPDKVDAVSAMNQFSAQVAAYN